MDLKNFGLLEVQGLKYNIKDNYIKRKEKMKRRLIREIENYKFEACKRCGGELKNEEIEENFPTGLCEKCRKKSDSIDAPLSVQLENYGLKADELELDEEAYGKPGRPKGKKDIRPRKKRSWLYHTIFKHT